MSRANTLADWAAGAGEIPVSTDTTNGRLGVATGTPTSTFQVGPTIKMDSAAGIVTAATFVGTLSGSASTATAASNAYGILGTPSINVAAVTATSGSISADLTVTGNLTVSGTTDLDGVSETVGVGSTSTGFLPAASGKVILECNAQNGTVFTHNLANGTVGIVSLRNFPVTKNSVTTFTIIFTQSSTAPTGGIGNTTVGTGIGTNITLTPLGVAGFTTSARVATASTVTLSTTANDIDIVTLAIHYNGSGTGTAGNYRVFATNNTGFRFGNVGF